MKGEGQSSVGEEESTFDTKRKDEARILTRNVRERVGRRRRSEPTLPEVRRCHCTHAIHVKGGRGSGLVVLLMLLLLLKQMLLLSLMKVSNEVGLLLVSEQSGVKRC